MADSYLGMSGNHTGKTFDKFLELTPEDTTPASGDFSNVIEIGTGLIDADIVFDVSAVGDSESTVEIQLSDDAAFTTPVTVASVSISKTGNTIFPFRNAPGDEKPYGFVRLSYKTASSLTLCAFIAKK